MLIEDNPDVRAYLRSYLDPSYRVLEAADGEAGLQKAIQKMPDLVISDVMMPQMDGFELCGKLKTDPRTSHIPVILLTARAGIEDKIGGLETGADDYLVKPVDAKELMVRLKNLIEQRRRLRARFRRELGIAPEEMNVTSMEEAFLARAVGLVEAHLDDSDFDTRALARDMGFSRSQLNRKLRALTDHSTVEFIRILRLKHAARLLRQHAGNVAEIAYAVGFNNPAYFAECFRKLFGINPSEYGKA